MKILSNIIFEMSEWHKTINRLSLFSVCGLKRIQKWQAAKKRKIEWEKKQRIQFDILKKNIEVVFLVYVVHKKKKIWYSSDI
jgi:hypothetical protein